METFFPKCRPLFWRKRHEQRHQQKHETTRRRTTHVIIIITLLLPHRAVPFSDALLLCAVRLFFSKAAFVLHQRATTLLRVVFLVSRVDLSEDIERTTQNCTTHNSFCFQKNDTNVSLSLCVCSFSNNNR